MVSQLFTPGNVGAHEDPKWHINKPFGFSWFPKELAPIPRSWAATTGDLVFYRQHNSVSAHISLYLIFVAKRLTDLI
jgi:hypothetical protein